MRKPVGDSYNAIDSVGSGSSQGGAIYAIGNGTRIPIIFVSGCDILFEENEATGTGASGGVICCSWDVEYNDGKIIFFNNKADATSTVSEKVGGGAICYGNIDFSGADVKFQGNTAKCKGGELCQYSMLRSIAVA